MKIEISHKTIIFTVFFLLGLYFLWLIKDLILSFFIAFVIAGALRPLVDFLRKYHLPKTLSSFLVYILFLLVIFYLFSIVIPPIVKELNHLFYELPRYQLFVFNNEVFNLSKLLNDNLPNLTGNFFSLIKNLFSNVLFIISTLFFGFYLLNDEKFILNTLLIFYEEKEAVKINHLILLSQKKASQWFWGEVILMIVVGIMTYLGLTFLNVKYALALAVLAGFLEIVPNIGPIISAIPAILIGLSSSYLNAFYIVLLYFVVQQFENNLIVPLIMNKVTETSPITILLSLMIGEKIAGVMGVLLAVPTLVFLKTFLIEKQKIASK